MRKTGAKPKILKYMKEHVGEWVSRDDLKKLVNNVGGWERSVRRLRDDGYEVIYDRSIKSYKLPYKEPVHEPKDSRYISQKLQAMVLIRDNATCQMCGKTVKEDHIKLVMDHVVPLDWGGKTEMDNLQALCRVCNEGKKAFVKGENPKLMENITNASNTEERLRLYFDYYYNMPIGVDKLAVIAKTREWTRQLRKLRQDYSMDIEYLAPNKKMQRERAAYIYWKLAGRKIRKDMNNNEKKKYVIDTNILYKVAFQDGEKINLINADKILKNNYCIVTYATLFEAFSKYKNDRESLKLIINIIDKYKIDVAALEDEKEDIDEFWELIYKKSLSNEEIEKLRIHLIEQTCRWIVKFLGQFFNCFAFIYANIKMDEADSAYNFYIKQSIELTDSFSHFPKTVEKKMGITFTDSYFDPKTKKFKNSLNDELNGIAKIIDASYNVLSSKNSEFINNNDFDKDIYDEFDILISNETDNYIDCIKNTIKNMSKRKKRVKIEDEIFSLIDTSNLKGLESDYLLYCLKKIFCCLKKFEYNDIVDYINLSTAYNYSDGLITLDDKFLNGVSDFQTLKDSVFYKNSKKMNMYLKSEHGLLDK